MTFKENNDKINKILIEYFTTAQFNILSSFFVLEQFSSLISEWKTYYGSTNTKSPTYLFGLHITTIDQYNSCTTDAFAVFVLRPNKTHRICETVTTIAQDVRVAICNVFATLCSAENAGAVRCFRFGRVTRERARAKPAVVSGRINIRFRLINHRSYAQNHLSQSLPYRCCNCTECDCPYPYTSGGGVRGTRRRHRVQYTLGRNEIARNRLLLGNIGFHFYAKHTIVTVVTSSERSRANSSPALVEPIESARGRKTLTSVVVEPFLCEL